MFMMLTMVLSSLVVVGALLILPLFYNIISVVAGYKVVVDENSTALLAFL
jgi:hypothetical protein